MVLEPTLTFFLVIVIRCLLIVNWRWFYRISPWIAKNKRLIWLSLLLLN